MLDHPQILIFGTNSKQSKTPKRRSVNKQTGSVDGVIIFVLLGKTFILKSQHQCSRIDFRISKSEAIIPKMIMSSANRRILTSYPDGSPDPAPL